MKYDIFSKKKTHPFNKIVLFFYYRCYRSGVAHFTTLRRVDIVLLHFSTSPRTLIGLKYSRAFPCNHPFGVKEGQTPIFGLIPGKLGPAPVFSED